MVKPNHVTYALDKKKQPIMLDQLTKQLQYNGSRNIVFFVSRFVARESRQISRFSRFDKSRDFRDLSSRFVVSLLFYRAMRNFIEIVSFFTGHIVT